MAEDKEVKKKRIDNIIIVLWLVAYYYLSKKVP